MPLWEMELQFNSIEIILSSVDSDTKQYYKREGKLIITIISITSLCANNEDSEYVELGFGCMT